MSNTLRDATERTVHTITDLVGDAMHHIDLPHIDLPRAVRGRRRSLSPAVIVAFVAAIAVVAVVVTRSMRGKSSTGTQGGVMAVASEADATAAAAA